MARAYVTPLPPAFRNYYNDIAVVCVVCVCAAAIPIGAHEPAWFMKGQHCSPAEAMTIHKELGAKRSFAVHWVSSCRLCRVRHNLCLATLLFSVLLLLLFVVFCASFGDVSSGAVDPRRLSHRARTDDGQTLVCGLLCLSRSRLGDVSFGC